MDASLLAGIHVNGGKPVYQSTDGLLESQFAKAVEMRPLYEAFLKLVKKQFPNSTVLPKKTYVSILENREFAAINIKPKELRIGLDLGDRTFDETVEKRNSLGRCRESRICSYLRTQSSLMTNRGSSERIPLHLSLAKGVAQERNQRIGGSEAVCKQFRIVFARGSSLGKLFADREGFEF